VTCVDVGAPSVRVKICSFPLTSPAYASVLPLGDHWSPLAIPVRPAAPTHYEAGMRLFIFTIKARNGLLKDNKSGPDNQMKELGQTELRNESFAASNQRCPEQT